MKLTKLIIYSVKMSENSFKLYNLLIWKVNLLISLKRQTFKSFRCVYTRTTWKVNWQCYNNIFNDLYIKNIWCTFSTRLFCIYFQRIQIISFSSRILTSGHLNIAAYCKRIFNISSSLIASTVSSTFSQ